MGGSNSYGSDVTYTIYLAHQIQKPNHLPDYESKFSRIFLNIHVLFVNLFILSGATWLVGEFVKIYENSIFIVSELVFGSGEQNLSL